MRIRFPDDGQVRFVAASGAGAFTGIGWPHEWLFRQLGQFDLSRMDAIVLKTLTAEPRRGNLNLMWPWGCIRLIKGGVVNCVGLTNKGIDWWCREIGPLLDFDSVPLVASILGTSEELAVMTGKLNLYPKLAAVEVNASCPNTDADVLTNTGMVIEDCRCVREATDLPVWLKLSVVHDLATIVEATKGWVDLITLNSVPWKVACPGRVSPLAHLGGGGVSGGIVQPITWEKAAKITDMTETPVAWPSLWDYSDIQKMYDRGARVVSVGSVLITKPWASGWPDYYRREHT